MMIEPSLNILRSTVPIPVHVNDRPVFAKYNTANPLNFVSDLFSTLKLSSQICKIQFFKPIEFCE